MARESKGQQVKAFKTTVPQPNQSTVSEVKKVYFKADDQKFFIYLPEHIGVLVKSGVEGLDENQFGAYVAAEAMQDVLDAWKAVCERYASLLRTEGAVKVIRYRFLNQGAGGDMFTDPFRFDNGANLGPGIAMLLDYEVLWRSGNRLYYGHYEGDELRLQDKGPVPDPVGRSWEKNRLIEWSEDREQFFDGMRAGLKGLINQIVEFIGGDLEANIAALASGERTLAIAGPAHG